MTLAMSGATPSDSGLASGLVNTTQQVGGALGLAVLATLSTDAHRRPARRAATATASALTGGYHLAFAHRRRARARRDRASRPTVLRSERAVALEAAPAEQQPAVEVAYSEAA